MCVCVCVCVCVYACTLSHVRLFANSWTAACQAPLSMGFPRQEYWSGPCMREDGSIQVEVLRSDLQGVGVEAHRGSPQMAWPSVLQGPKMQGIRVGRVIHAGARASSAGQGI